MSTPPPRTSPDAALADAEAARDELKKVDDAKKAADAKEAEEAAAASGGMHESQAVVNGLDFLGTIHGEPEMLPIHLQHRLGGQARREGTASIEVVAHDRRSRSAGCTGGRLERPRK